MWRVGSSRIRTGDVMSILTEGKDYIIDLGPYLFKVEKYNYGKPIRLDSFEVMYLMLSFIISNNIESLNTNRYYQQFKSDGLDELIVELADDFHLDFILPYDIDCKVSATNLISYSLDIYGELIFSVKTVKAVIMEDLDDLWRNDNAT